MKNLITAIVDKFQAIFPPNRLMLILAGPITAASIWLSAWITTHVPGAELPVGVVAGAIGAAALITITLIYKWFDQWQKGEPIPYDADLEAALAELSDSPDVQEFFRAHGTIQAIAQALEDLRTRIEEGKVNEADIHSAIASLVAVAGTFLQEHPIEQQVQPVPAVAAPPAPPVAAPPAA
jgi:hypothetical protein